MVQQVASLKTESAASALPLNANAFSASLLNQHSRNAQSFNAEFLRQTQQVEIVRQPTINQVQMNKPNSRTSNSNELRHDPVNSNRRETVSDRHQEQRVHQDRSDEQHRSQQRNEQRQLEARGNTQNRSKTTQGASNTDDSVGVRKNDSAQALPNERDVQNSFDKTKAAQRLYYVKDLKGGAEASGVDTSAPKDATKIKLNDDTTNDEIGHYGTPDEKFDYINFVTELAEFSHGDSSAKTQAIALESQTEADLATIGINSLGLNTVDSINADTVTESVTQESVAKEISELTNVSEQIANNALQGDIDLRIANQQNGEFTSISLSVDDLQSILDAKNIELDLNSELSLGDLHKLETIIGDMLNQLHAQQTDATSEQDAQALKNIDQALLLSLILGGKADKQQKSNNRLDSTQETAVNASSKRQDVINNAAKTASLLSENNALGDAAKVTNPTSATSAEKSDLSSMIDDAAVSDMNKKPVLESSAKDEKAKLINDLLVPKVAVAKTTNDKPENTDANRSALHNMSALNEEQARLALESITQRVQSISKEIAGEKAGNEFIAALQSGLKEFKQQLAKGREPGIDLKAIVSEALAAANVDATAKMPKIENAINQVNAVMNLANGVNHSASLQQAQLLGVNDTPMSKDMAQLSAESLKGSGASATQQASAQAAADKAINIFKQEGQKQLAEKVRWMVNNKSASAEIRLDPPDLGGVNIKVSMSGDNAQVNFNVQSNAAKEALDQAVPRLREMLQEQGIELGQSSVEQDNSRQHGDNATGEFASSENNSGNGTQMANETRNDANTSEDEAENTVIEQRISGSSVGGIDYYA
jgi:flagellar hook-length control protein FliK